MASHPSRPALGPEAPRDLASAAERYGLSEIARRLGVSRATVGQWAVGRSRPSRRNLGLLRSLARRPGEDGPGAAGPSGPGLARQVEEIARLDRSIDRVRRCCALMGTIASRAIDADETRERASETHRQLEDDLRRLARRRRILVQDLRRPPPPTDGPERGPPRALPGLPAPRHGAR
ncbi:helix-turn-helix domain-containing protein [Methylobacterium sp. WSM2598]|uniref:helix-turn-helix domain-containing protein n=1 Tax=Methylobacterium sp. WSM2598 TaxID=398261 RepID=UPI0003602649|nr:helix-turn-helix domain-containing protein [Methylobacterium sp. WSM2598]